MKKLLVVAVAVALALPAVAWSASPYLSSFKAGTYKGVVKTPVAKELDGKPVTAKVTPQGDKVVLEVTFPDSFEVWEVTDKVLTQIEKEKATGKTVQSYAATATDTSKPNVRVFNVNCDKAKGTCDAGINPKGHWDISVDQGKIQYMYWGVAKTEPNGPVTNRFTVDLALAQ